MKNKSLRTPPLIATLHVKANSPANPSYVLVAILIGLQSVALISALVCKKK